MPNRMLREGILTSQRVAELSWPAEVFYRRVMSVVDDFGRFYAHPKLLRAACYPLLLDRVSDPDIGKWLTECVTAGLIRTYQVSSKQYLELLDFRQQVRAKESKYPAFDEQTQSTCVADATQLLADAHLDVDVDVDEGGAENSGKKPPESPRPKKKKPQATPLPDDFKVSERVQKWAAERRFDHLDEHLEVFISKARAKGYTYVDWDDAFMSCIREDWGKLRGHEKSSGAAVPLWER